MPGNNEQVTVTEEIIDNPGIVTEDIIPENSEVIPEIDLENSEEQETKEEEEFTTDDLDLSENETSFGKYDLSKYKNDLAFENIEAMENLKQFAQKVEELGFDQNQVEFILDNIYELNQETEEQKPQKMTKAEVETNLKKHLTPDERRDYKTVDNFVKETVKGTEFEGLERNIMTDPLLVKMARMFYKKSTGGKVINQAPIKQGADIKYTVENAQKQYDKYLKDNPESKREEKTTFLSNLYKKMPEKEKMKFENIFDGLFNK